MGEKLFETTDGASGDDQSMTIVGAVDRPKTAETTARISRNTSNGGTRVLLRELARMLRTLAT